MRPQAREEILEPKKHSKQIQIHSFLMNCKYDGWIKCTRASPALPAQSHGLDTTANSTTETTGEKVTFFTFLCTRVFSGRHGSAHQKAPGRCLHAYTDCRFAARCVSLADVFPREAGSNLPSAPRSRFSHNTATGLSVLMVKKGGPHLVRVCVCVCGGG